MEARTNTLKCKESQEAHGNTGEHWEIQGDGEIGRENEANRCKLKENAE